MTKPLNNKQNKFFIVYDNNTNSLKIKKILEKKITFFSLSKSNIIIVIGGDGFMLHTLKKLHYIKKPFYGLNSGNYGFLMNKFSEKNFLRNIKSLNSIQINPLEMVVTTKKNQKKKQLLLMKFLF